MPSRQPALTILVVIDTPRGPNPPYGGTVAAPIFKRIADAALRYLGVAPTINPAPPVLAGQTRRGGDGADERTRGPGHDRAGSARSPRLPGRSSCPTFAGWAGARRSRVLTRLGLTPRVTGDGVVIEQDPAAGQRRSSPAARAGSRLGRLAPGVPPMTLAALLAALGDLVLRPGNRRSTRRQPTGL